MCITHMAHARLRADQHRRRVGLGGLVYSGTFQFLGAGAVLSVLTPVESNIAMIDDVYALVFLAFRSRRPLG